MITKELVEIKKILENIASESGNILERHFYNKNLEVTIKSDKSPVTNADIESQEYIVKELNKYFPGVPIVSEEQSFKTNSLAISKEFFLIDPLDSTKNFATGIPIFDVSIAYVSKFSPRVGIVRDPINKTTYSSIESHGAYANEKRINVRQCQNLQDADLDLNIPKLPDDQFKIIALELSREAKKVRYFGCAVLEICWISCGIIDAIINHRLSIWDVAACTLILKEAGGFAYDLSGNEYTYDTLDKRPILAVGDKRISDYILNALKK
ncbi:MAG: inositol-1-monophosphatase [Candidatus Scalindua rubra]|uniref:Inositol-1-monophosphatase n=1 Tax=Candidatus Scalindua rubra TaxID=1872076 RepID=A0A1E3X9I3_9BACT|nr:MAG: inositol-1-monophosphatase [Candidatus Scalindua rubra]